MSSRRLIDKSNFVEYISIFLLLYLMSGYNMTVVQALSGSVRILILLFFSIILCYRNKVNSIKVVPFSIIIILFITALLSLLFRSDALYNYAILISAVLIGYLFYIAIDFKVFVNAYVNIMVFLSIFSLVAYFLALVIPSVISYFPIINYTYGISVHDMFFSVMLNGPTMQRNYGMFWEPGAFQVFLNLALSFEVFTRKNIRIKKVVILILTIVSTFSTTGYFALGFILMAFFFNRNNKTSLELKHKIHIKRMVLIFMVCLVIAFTIPSDYKNLVFAKLSGLFNKNEQLAVTTKARVDAIIYPLKAFSSSPLFGIGYDDFNVLNTQILNGLATSTVLNWLSLFGISWGIPCILFYLKNLKRFGVTILSRFFLIVAFLLLISTESFLGNPFIYMFIFYGSEVVGSKKKSNKDILNANHAAVLYRKEVRL